jgi:hypothetical protein
MTDTTTVRCPACGAEHHVADYPHQVFCGECGEWVPTDWAAGWFDEPAPPAEERRETMALTEHQAGKLLWAYGADISRYVNSLDGFDGMTIYSAEQVATMTPADDGFVTIGVCLMQGDDELVPAAIQLHPTTGEFRVEY